MYLTFLSMFVHLIFPAVYLLTSYIFLCEVHQCWINVRRKDEILLYRESFKNVLKKPIFLFCGLTCALFLFHENHNNRSLKVAIPVLHIIRLFICSPERNDVLEKCNLNIGYGAALWYYKNYLDSLLSDSFLDRVRTFESCNKVKVEKKLFILVPESCIVQRYLDDETDSIERCHELPTYEKTNTGFKGRQYNNTVYLVKSNSVKKRMVVEYAQPLKGLYLLKEKKLLTESDMFYERKLFAKSLCEFLKDKNHSYKICEVVEYNDYDRKVHDVLLEHCHLENSIYEIV